MVCSAAKIILTELKKYYMKILLLTTYRLYKVGIKVVD